MKTSPPAPLNSSDNPSHPTHNAVNPSPFGTQEGPALEAGLLEIGRKTGGAAVQLLHALLSFRRLGLPLEESRQPGLFYRAKQLHRLCISLLEHLRVQVHLEGNLPPSGMLVTNHVSFLDIMFLGALRPMVFVSKSEVARWPLVGTIASCAGTLYVERSRKADVSRVNKALARALEEGVLVTLFPEGTSSDGTSILPFLPSLLQPAVDARIPVAPGYLEYTGTDGHRADDVGYFGERELSACLLALLKRKRLNATLRCAPTVEPGMDRKQLTALLHAKVCALMEPNADSR